MNTRILFQSLPACLLIPVFAACHSDEKAGPPVSNVLPEPAAATQTPQVKPALVGHLTLLAPGQAKSVRSLEELAKEFPLGVVQSVDPNYGVQKSFFAIPLAPLLRKYFDELEGARLMLIASDGYSVEVEAAVLLSEDAFLALGDDQPGEFAPISERKVDAGPVYLVWKGDRYTDAKRYPRPWSLSTIEKLDSADRYEHTRPEAGFGTNEPAKLGYQVFSASCIRCHAINREGGRVGPDLEFRF
jgi:hypothetical protein